jgi:hypothetical protein
MCDVIVKNNDVTIQLLSDNVIISVLKNKRAWPGTFRDLGFLTTFVV